MHRRTLLLGVDIGTSGTKAVLFTPQGETVAEAARRYPMTQPRGGWAEQHPSLWRDAVCACLRELMARPQTEGAEILSLGLSGQMHGSVLLDGEGNPTAPAILWCDTRVQAECAEIEDIFGGEMLTAVTGNRALCNFTAPKLMWMRRHTSDALRRAKTLLLPKDYIRFCLTGKYVAEPSDACGTLLYDTRNFRWSEELCRGMGIDPALLPPLVKSAEVVGTVTPEAAAATGLPVGIPVVGGAGDNAASAVGVGAVLPGRAFVTVGTSGNVYTHTDRFAADAQGRFHTFCSAVPGEWTFLGAVQSAGLNLRWFRETCCGSLDADAADRGMDPYALLDEEAASCAAGGGGLFYLPYLLGERTPHLDPHARGCFIGLRPDHDRGAMARVVMEGVSFALADCMELFDACGVQVRDITLCGGGGKSALWRQIMADIFARPVASPGVGESAAFGAALLGAVGIGLYPDIPSACAAVCTAEDSTVPLNAAEYARIYRVWQTLYPALKASFAAAAAMSE